MQFRAKVPPASLQVVQRSNRDRDRDRERDRDLREINAVGRGHVVVNNLPNPNSSNTNIPDDWALDEDGERVPSRGGGVDSRPGAQSTVRLSVGAIMRSRTAQSVSVEASLTGGGLDVQEKLRVGHGNGIHAARPATEGSSATGSPATLPLALSQPRPVHAVSNVNSAGKHMQSNNIMRSTSTTEASVKSQVKAGDDDGTNVDEDLTGSASLNAAKQQRPHSRKLYLGSAKQQDGEDNTAAAAAVIVSSNYDNSDPTTRGPRPTSRKLYLGSDTSVASSHTSASGNGKVEDSVIEQPLHVRHPRSAGANRPSPAVARKNKHAVNSDGKNMDVEEDVSTHAVLKRLSSFAGFASSSLTSTSPTESGRDSKGGGRERESRKNEGRRNSGKHRKSKKHATENHDNNSSSDDSDAGSNAVIRALALQGEEQRPPSRQASAFPVRLDSSEANVDNADDVHEVEEFVKEWDGENSEEQRWKPSANFNASPGTHAHGGRTASSLPASSPAFLPTTPPRRGSHSNTKSVPVDLNDLSSDDEIFTRRSDRAYRRDGGSNEKPDTSVISSISARILDPGVTASPIQTSGGKRSSGNGSSSGRKSASPITQKLLLEQEQQSKAALNANAQNGSSARDISGETGGRSSSRYVSDTRPIGGDGSPNFSIFQVNANQANGKASESSSTTGISNNQYARADLPTRGVCDPISDGFALLGDDDGRWPFAIQVNYSNSTQKHRKGSGTLKSGTFASPGSISSPHNAGVTITDTTSERSHNLRKSPHSDDLMSDKLGAAAITKHSPVGIIQHTHVQGPSTQFATENVGGHGHNNKNVAIISSEILGAGAADVGISRAGSYDSKLAPVAPSTPILRGPKRASAAKHMSELSSLSKDTTSGNNNSNTIGNSNTHTRTHSNEINNTNKAWSNSGRGVLAFGAASTATSTSSTASEYESTNNNTNTAINTRVSNWGSDGSDDDGYGVGEDGDGGKWDGNRWVYPHMGQEARDDEHDDFTGEEDEDEDSREDEDEQDNGESESFEFEDGGFCNDSREVNGIFNIQAELLGSSLGEDFLSLFAKHAPPRPPAHEKHGKKK